MAPRILLRLRLRLAGLLRFLIPAGLAGLLLRPEPIPLGACILILLVHTAVIVRVTVIPWNKSRDFLFFPINPGFCFGLGLGLGLEDLLNTTVLSLEIVLCASAVGSDVIQCIPFLQTIPNHRTGAGGLFFFKGPTEEGTKALQRS